MSAADQASLVEMGFESQRAALAIQASSNLQQALDWLEKNQDRSTEELVAAETAASGPAVRFEGAPGGADSTEALSLVCVDCGKRLASMDAANLHGSRTGHTNFEESTDEYVGLTEQEKAAKLADLQEKSRARKEEKAKADLNEAHEREKLRRKVTKESQDAKEEAVKKKHLKHAAEAKQQKIDDASHRKKVLEKLRLQRQEQQKRDEAEKAARRGEAPPPEPVRSFDPSGSGGSGTAAVPDSVRLQLRFPDGPPLVKTLAKTATLAELASIAAAERGLDVTKLSLMPTRKAFGPDQFDTTLVDAGVAGSAVFIFN